MNRLIVLISVLSLFISCCNKGTGDDKIPVIVISDLYSPGQDVGDNFDILTPYALENIDLKAVVFDVTEDFRNPSPQNTILRDPGFIVVEQLNYLFDKQVPCGCGPFDKLRTEDDAKTDVYPYQTRGVDLMLKILRESDKPVHILSTGSCRPLAVAYNRDPELMTSKKVAAVHISAGASSDKFMEWNVALDSLAAARVLKSDMNMVFYPCATIDGPFARDCNNTFWSLRDLGFVFDMEPYLRNYTVYQLLSIRRMDYLNYLTQPLSEEDIKLMEARRVDEWYGSGGCHYVWETALWQQVAGLKLVEHKDGSASLLREDQIGEGDRIFEEELRYVTVDVQDNGLFSFRYSDRPTNVKIYYRCDAWENERLLNMALPKLYKSYKSNLK